ncbi:hypothetical protein [Methylomonas rhizoryzae]|uniref:hypothetical protein n=1 Tax=Methylomonas rhizoryzae TaxID=2608981 RepID=UPI0012327B39|nr:hypothetical protein [Methylomonas rhizoryzae]
MAAGQALYEAAADAPIANPLHAIAAQKLRSAQVLLEQQYPAGVMDLLAAALIAKTATEATVYRQTLCLAACLRPNKPPRYCASPP